MEIRISKGILPSDIAKGASFAVTFPPNADENIAIAGIDFGGMFASKASDVGRLFSRDPNWIRCGSDFDDVPTVYHDWIFDKRVESDVCRYVFALYTLRELATCQTSS